MATRATLPRGLRAILTVLTASLAIAVTGCNDGPPATAAAGRQPATATPAPAPAPISKGTATLRWTAPTQTSTGEPLTDLAGYRVYYGQTTFRLDRIVTLYDPAATMTVVNNLGSGTWFFAVSAFTRGGAESVMSNVVSKYIP